MNGTAGYLLAFGGDEPGEAGEPGLRLSLRSRTFRLILAVLVSLTGLLKILSPADIPVIGDLLPALLGLAAGFVLFFGYYRDQATVEPENVIRLEETIRRYKKILGIALLVSAVLHFIFPRALIL